MNNNFKSWLALSLLFGLGASPLAGAQPRSEAEAKIRITVLIYDYAEVKPQTLAEARKVATSVLRKAGVETTWLDCSGANVRQNPACDRFLAPTDLVLRIIRPSKATRAALRHDTCGIAYLAKNGRGGTHATVFYNGLKEIAKGQRLPPSLILGHTLAHEIGHLLLGSTRHTRQGIMRAVLDPNDWRLAGMGWLVFTPGQARQLRAEVRARVREQEAAVQSEVKPAD